MQLFFERTFDKSENVPTTWHWYPITKIHINYKKDRIQTVSKLLINTSKKKISFSFN